MGTGEMIAVWVFDALLFDEVSLSGNRYESTGGDKFRLGDFGAGTNYDNLTDWAAVSGESGSSETTFSFYEPTRTIETYQTSLGGTPTIDAFLESVASNTRDQWDDRYTAAALNRYIRHGFCESACGQPEEPTGVNVVTN